MGKKNKTVGGGKGAQVHKCAWLCVCMCVYASKGEIKLAVNLTTSRKISHNSKVTFQ